MDKQIKGTFKDTKNKCSEWCRLLRNLRTILILYGVDYSEIYAIEKCKDHTNIIWGRLLRNVGVLYFSFLVSIYLFVQEMSSS